MPVPACPGAPLPPANCDAACQVHPGPQVTVTQPSGPSPAVTSSGKPSWCPGWARGHQGASLSDMERVWSY